MTLTAYASAYWILVANGFMRHPMGAQVRDGRAYLTDVGALLADPPVLLLDEPTEGLDPGTADAVLADLLDATRGRTTLLVTHHPAGLSVADEVAVLDAGRVIQHGTHDELLTDPGYYHDLIHAHQLVAR